MPNKVSRRDFIKTTAAAAAATAAGAQAGVAKRPNILYIMTDQQPLSCVAAYGNRQIQTPHMDRIAAGVKFNDYYLSAFPCSPSRASVLSGRYPHSHGVMTNDVLFDPNVPCLGDIFKARGYDTAYIGKWHLGGSMYRGMTRKRRGWFNNNWYFKTEPAPERGFKTVPVEGGLGEDGAQHGFDHWVGGWRQFQQWLRDRGREDLAKRNPGNHNALPSKPEGQHMVSLLGEDYHMAKFFCDEAAKFIGDPKRGDNPFCMVLSFFAPHLPVCPPPPWDKMYPLDTIPLPASNKDSLANKPFRQKGNKRCYMGGGRWTDEQFKDYIARYWGYTSYLDHQMGRVLDALDQAALTEDTIIVFTTDHGDMVGAHGFIYKQIAGYEELMHCPLAIRYDKMLKPGTVVDRTVETVDVLPTLLDMAGAAHPKGIQGRSALPLMLGKDDGGWDDAAFCEMQGAVMAKKGDWKFTYYWRGRDLDELYNLKDDPHELVNLAVQPEHAQRVKDMQEMIFQWAEDTHHPFGELLRKAKDRRLEIKDVEPKINSLKYEGNNKLKIDLAWRVGEDLSKETPYWTFVHFIHPKSKKLGKIEFRLTKWPKKPTTEWRTGETYHMGPVEIPIPPNAPAGTYTVRIGLYNPKKRTSPTLRSGTNCQVMGELTIAKEGGKVSRARFKPGP